MSIARSGKTAEKIIALLQETPMTATEVGEKMGYQASNTACRVLKIIAGIAVIDWRYIGTALAPIYGLSDTNITREAWYIQHGIPTEKRARKARNSKKTAAPKPQDAIQITPRKHHKKTYGEPSTPAKVSEAFQRGASTVLFEGIKYSKEMAA